MSGLILGSAALGMLSSEPNETFRDCHVFGKRGDVSLNPLGLSGFGGSGFGRLLRMCRSYWARES